MRKLFSRASLFALTVSALAMGGAFMGASSAQATDLKASLYWGPKSPIAKGGYVPFIKAAEEAEGSTLKFRLFTGGSLLDSKGVMAGLSQGIADLGSMALTYFPAELPNAQLVADLAMLGKNSVIAAAAVSEYNMLHCKECLTEWDKQNLVYTGTYSTTPYIMIAKKPITTLADLKGMKIRSPGSVWDRWVESVGAVPVNVSSSDMYEAFDRGIVDVVIHTPAALTSVNLGDFAKAVIDLPLGTYDSLSMASYNKNTWQNMTVAERKMILDLSPIMLVGISDAYAKQDAAAMEAGAKKGIELVTPSAELVQATEQFRANDMATIMESAKSKHGIPDAEAKAAKLEELFNKWDALLRPHLNDPDKMMAIVKAELYDKIDPATYGM